MTEPAPLILTLALDASTFAALDGLRRAHFPADRNVVPAHVTLFHHLPGDDADDVAAAVAEVCAATAPFAVRFPRVRSLGRGVAAEVEAPGLVRVRAALAARWADRLAPQDRQPYRPHVTVQNKVAAAEARALFEWLSATWSPLDGRGEGLLLWRYRGGPWEPAGAFPFAGP